MAWLVLDGAGEIGQAGGGGEVGEGEVGVADEAEVGARGVDDTVGMGAACEVVGWQEDGQLGEVEGAEAELPG